MYRDPGRGAMDSKCIALSNLPSSKKGKGRPRGRPGLETKAFYFFDPFFFPKVVSTEEPICVSICFAASA
jgi:hypothetical protein